MFWFCVGGGVGEAAAVTVEERGVGAGVEEPPAAVAVPDELADALPVMEVLELDLWCPLQLLLAL